MAPSKAKRPAIPLRLDPESMAIVKAAAALSGESQQAWAERALVAAARAATHEHAAALASVLSYAERLGITPEEMVSAKRRRQE